MLCLAIDTAGRNCAVALAAAGAGGVEMLARSDDLAGRGHAERLIPMTKTVLAEAGRHFGDIDRVAVTVGPGSFTGLRVGVAAARGLALALDIPAAGIGTLAALAREAAEDAGGGTVVASLHDGRGGIHVRAADAANGAVLVEVLGQNPAILSPLLAEAPRPLVLIGSASQMVAEILAERDLPVTRDLEFPDIRHVASLGLEAKDFSPPSPLYGRGADAASQTHKAVPRR